MRRRWAALGCAVLLSLLAGCGLPAGVDGDLTDGWVMPSAPVQFRPVDGKCFDTVPTNTAAQLYEPLDCTQRHVSETFHVGDLTGRAAAVKTNDGDHLLPLRTANAECRKRADRFTGAPWRTGRLLVMAYVPSIDGWKGGARWFRCDLAEMSWTRKGTDTVERTGSLRGSLAGRAPLKLRCFDGSGGPLGSVSCSKPHDMEFAGLWTAPGEDREKVTGKAAMGKGCYSVIARFTGVPDDNMIKYRVGWVSILPEKYLWEAGDRQVQCFLWSSEKVQDSFAGAGPGRLPVD
jgi:hypothetical protein